MQIEKVGKQIVSLHEAGGATSLWRNEKMTKQPLKIIAGDPDRPLIIGDIEISCFVLEDETRVISKKSLSSALNAAGGG